ncbi:MAG: haloacid dehalogenase type II [Acidimicrobiia bacterium]|nr:haloacid dehalogenase type II [Acidimicrobiia bacterium]
MNRPSVLVFDVNETLLDLTELRSVLSEALGSSERLAEWFFRLLHGSLVANTTDSFRSFETLGTEALRAVALRQGIELSASQAGDLVAGFRSLPPHQEVPNALERLANRFRLIALSNGSPEGISAQLSNAGIVDSFEMVVSVHDVGRFKPDPAPYRAALERAGADPGDVLMVAAHDWDIIGARAVGIPGAFIERPGVVWTVPHDAAELVVTDIGELADALDAR